MKYSQSEVKFEQGVTTTYIFFFLLFERECKQEKGEKNINPICTIMRFDNSGNEMDEKICHTNLRTCCASSKVEIYRQRLVKKIRSWRELANPVLPV